MWILPHLGGKAFRNVLTGPGDRLGALARTSRYGQLQDVSGVAGGGELPVRVEGDQVILTGQAVTVPCGELTT